MATLIQIRRSTLSEWSSANPILSQGEIGFVSDENKIKIGDGSTPFNSLDYLEADAFIDSVALGTDTTGNYIETLFAGDGISLSGEGVESASATITNTGVLSLTGTANEITVSASTGNVVLSLPTSITVDIIGNVTGNADTASALATARNISLGGDVSGSASFDGGSDITITATVADDSHDHTIANVDGLQTALDNNASSASAVASDLTDHENSTTNVHGIADTSLLATKDYADNSASAAAAALVDSAPETLNTLNELAAALGDDANFSTTVTDSIATKLSIASASATYLTQADAATTYDAIGSASAVASDLTDHENATTSVHGIADTSLLATTSYVDTAESDAVTTANAYSDSLATNYDSAGSADTAESNANSYTDGEISTHNSDTTNVHGIADTSLLATTSYVDTAESDAVSTANSYADSLASNYDAAGSASAVASDLTDHENSTTNVHGIADTSALATKTYADNAASTAVANLVDSAPSTLDTLNELAAALDDDPNFATTITNSIATKADDADLTSHENATTNVHGIADTSALATKTYADNAGVTSLTGTASEIDVSASSGAITLSLPATINADTTGNAATASTLEIARSISLSGDVSGSASFDGGSNVTITATVADDSHNHTISNVDGLQGALNDKLDSTSYTASDVLTKIKTVDGASSGLDSDLLDGQQGSHYLDWTNTTNKPDPTITLGGDLSGAVTLTNLGNGTLTATVADDSHNHIISNVDGLQTALDAKAPLASPALSGTPTAPTAASATNSTQIATTAFVQNAVGNLIDGAPGALDTLNELAASLGDDADFAGTVTNSLAGKQPLDSDLTAISGLSASATGYAKKTGDGTWSVGDVALGTDTTGNYVASISGTANEIEVTGSGSESAAVTLSLPATINANTTGSAASLTTARTISLGGDLSGSASFDGSSNITITAAVSDDSHNHTISNIDGLQTAIDAKLDSSSYTASDVLTKIKTVDGSTSGLDADLLDSQEGSYYLDWTNTTNKPDPTITLGGDASGSLTLTDLAGGTLTVTVEDDSHNHIISNIDGLQTALDAKAPLASPALSGTPTAPTASASANSTQIATTAFVQTAVSNLISGAPGALDTLDELAAALGDDANFASTVTNSLAGKQPLDADLTAIAALSGTSGFLKKTAADTWSLDTNTYLTGNQTITLTGDATGSGTTSISLALANSGVSAATYGSASAVPTITIDAKGRITSASATDIAIAQSAVTNLTTDLAAKAPLASPALTGTPTAPTASAGTNTTQIATTEFVNTATAAVQPTIHPMFIIGGV